MFLLLAKDYKNLNTAKSIWVYKYFHKYSFKKNVLASFW